jgi:hypothetical protein
MERLGPIGNESAVLGKRIFVLQYGGEVGDAGLVDILLACVEIRGKPLAEIIVDLVRLVEPLVFRKLFEKHYFDVERFLFGLAHRSRCIITNILIKIIQSCKSIIIPALATQVFRFLREIVSIRGKIL